MNLRKLILGAEKPNNLQLKFFANIFGDLSKAIFLGSAGLIFLPTEKPLKFGSVIVGVFVAGICAIIGSRLLKEVKK